MRLLEALRQDMVRQDMMRGAAEFGGEGTDVRGLKLLKNTVVLEGTEMVNCPNCDAVIDVDEEELDEGETLTCEECGTDLTVVGLDPLELETAGDEEEEEEEEEDFDYDEDEEEEEEEEDEEDWK